MRSLRPKEELRSRLRDGKRVPQATNNVTVRAHRLLPLPRAAQPSFDTLFSERYRKTHEINHVCV